MARPGDRRQWPERLITTLTEGGDGYCRHDSLRTYDRRTADLLARIREFGSTLDPTVFSGADIVHWDLHPGNLLTGDAGLTAIVDTDFAMVGDARFDVVTLALTSHSLPDCSSRPRPAAGRWRSGTSDSVPTQAYLAHLFLRLLDWPIRRGASDEVELWLDLSRTLLVI